MVVAVRKLAKIQESAVLIGRNQKTLEGPPLLSCALRSKGSLSDARPIDLNMRHQPQQVRQTS